MCGRFDLVAEGEEIATLFDLAVRPNLAPRYNIAPTQPVLAIFRQNRQERELTHFRWGLIPSWAKEPSMNLINARAETVAEKPSFRSAFKRRRCLIPATGFFEWQKVGKKKQPVRIVPSAESLFVFGGIWEYWQGADGSELMSCAILTTAANETIRPIHDRMPIFITPADFDLWLDPDAPIEAVNALLQPSADDFLRYYPVSDHVNFVGHDDPSCIVALA